MRSSSRLPLLLAALASLLFAPGFVCATRVERVEGEVDALRLQFEEIQQRINDDQAEVTAMLLRADSKLDELEELQRKYQDVLSKGILDVQLELDQSRSEVAELRGKLDITAHNLSKLQGDVTAVVSTLGMTSSGTAVQLPQDPNALYTFAEDAFNAGTFDVAAAAYQEFANRYGSDQRADEALYKLAVSYQRQQRYVDAIGAARQLLASFPQSKRVNDAIWLMGESAEARNDCAVAKIAYEQLKGTSSHGGQASKALKRIKASCP